MFRDRSQELSRLFKEAIQLYQEGRFPRRSNLRREPDLARWSYGESHRVYADSLHNLALLYHEMGDYASAEPLHRQAMEILRVALGESHREFAASLNNLAVCCIGRWATMRRTSRRHAGRVALA